MHDINLDKGLYLDVIDTIVEWSDTPEELLDKIGQKTKHSMNKNTGMNYVGYTIRSHILNMPLCFRVTFNFVGGKLTSISISNGEDIQNDDFSFERIQNDLELALGKPKGLSILSNFKKQKSYKWKFNKVTFEHSVVEREGLQHMLEIKIK